MTTSPYRSSCGCDGKPHRIDTHHHIFPPSYLAKERDRILAPAPGYTKQLTEWTPQKAIDEMDRNGVATAVTSISTPGIWFGNTEQTRVLARECNEYAATMSGEHKGRFGIFAALPLPDVDNSLKEITYALDVLGVDGFGLVTNYGDIMPGDPRLAPVFDELNRRKAVVYFHPTAAHCCINHGTGLPPAILEFPFDTTRAISSLLCSGTLSRCPDIRFIFSHGGGTLPMLAGRIARVLTVRKELAEKVPLGAMHEFRKLHYDMVSINTAAAFQAVRSLAEIPQLLFGSDFPYWSPSVAVEELSQLGLTDQEVCDIERNNALRLLPRLGTAMKANDGKN
ncbi:MAG: amidohydrolase family protein [Pseudomonadota bacterium]